MRLFPSLVTSLLEEVSLTVITFCNVSVLSWQLIRQYKYNKCNTTM